MSQTTPPDSPLLDGKWIVVDSGRKIFAEQILEGIKKFNPVIRDNFSSNYESNLIVLDRPVVTFNDLTNSRYAYQSLEQQNDLILDLKDNDEALQMLDSTIADKSVFIDELYEGSTFFVKHLYWQNYQTFCGSVLERSKSAESLSDDDRFKNEIKQSLEDLFFPERDNEHQILKKFRTLSRFFHTDKVPAEYQDCCRKMFDYLCEMKESIINYLNNPFDNEEQKMFEYVRKGKEEFDIAMNFKDILKKKNGEKVSNILPANWESFLSLTEVELLNNKKVHAIKACSFYQSAIRIVDKLVKKNLDYLPLQIEYRKKTAQAFFLGAHFIESQLYCISAIHLATDLESPTATVKDLQGLLNTILQGTNKATDQKLQNKFAESSSHSPNNDREMEREMKANEDIKAEFNSMTQALVVATKSDVRTKTQRNAFKQNIKRATTELVLRNAIRPDTSLVEYRTPAEEIEYTRKLAAVYYAGGVILNVTAGTVATAPILVVGAAVLASAEAVSLPMILTTTTTLIASGPVGWAIGAGFIVMGLAGGYYLRSKGRSAGQEPQRRERLNEIMTKAVEFYQKGAFIEMFETLSERFVDDQLLLFEREKKIEINEKKIVDALLTHNFRCDGIALLLHMIAEGLICADLKLDESEQGRTWLMERAKQIMKFLLDCSKLTENADNLDNLVYQSKSRLFNKTTQRISRYFQGIPPSYVKDAHIAPFRARLEEIRTLSLINRVTIMALDGDEYVKKNIRLVKDRLRTNFQYFSASTFRIDALQDFLVAMGYDDMNDDDEGFVNVPKPSVGKKELILGNPTASKLLWGNELLCAINEESIRDFTFSQFLTKVSPVLFGSNTSVLEYFNDQFERERSFYNTNVAAMTAASAPPPPPPPIIDELNKLIGYLKIQFETSGDNGKVSVEFLHLAAFSINHCLRVPILFVEEIDKSNVQGDIKTLYGLSSQRTKSTTANNWQNVYCIAQESLLSFQIYFDKDTSETTNIIEFAAAVNLQQARKYLGFAKSHRSICSMAQAMELYDKSISYFLRALYCFDPTWRYSFASLYRFVEVQALVTSVLNFRNSTTALPQRTWRTEEIDSVIGLMECYSSTFKYSKTLALVTVCINRTEFAKSHLFWYWYAVAARKSTYYFDGSYAIQKSLDICNTDESKREYEISKKLHETEINKTVKEYVDKSLQYSFGQSSGNRNSDFFDILSIDGGGIKGIIPAYWISIVERRCHRPIGRLVDLIAGTSTGSIIAGALSVNGINSQNPIPAHHLVNLYSDPTLIKDVFCKRFSLGGVLGPKYHDYRYNVVKQFVGDTLISNTITDVLITSVKESAKQTTHCFTSVSAKTNIYDKDCNVKLVDAIMASSAAPTYFASYKINQASFIDGGMQANNPASLAYHHARENGHNNIRVWSLGTGDYISGREEDYNPLRGVLYWASNVYDIAVASQQGLIDRELSSSLGENYRRWQVWMHEPIMLDDYGECKLKNMVEYARQFVEEADASDDNSINKVVESLLAKVE